MNKNGNGYANYDEEIIATGSGIPVQEAGYTV